ncbi:hypothetical protein V9T40_003465 [Parthenolecanium corni]|uniref:Inclusion body protein n=1 Tax=Parthenolecanium corni TaxID=536013 RepID=A0AAN9TV41_9HEMI
MYFLCVFAFLLSLSTFSYAEVVDTTKFGSKLSPSFIDTIFVIDTQSVMRAYPNASKNPETPTPITHQYGYMIISKEHVNSSQGTVGSYLYFVAVGDILRWYGVSESANLFNQVILYNIKQHSKILSSTRTLPFGQSVLQPNSTSIQDLYPVNVNFIGLEATALKTGISFVGHEIYFGLYYHDDNGNPTLFGYFRTVNFKLM